MENKANFFKEVASRNIPQGLGLLCITGTDFRLGIRSKKHLFCQNYLKLAPVLISFFYAI